MIYVAYLIVFFGSINLVRMGLFLIGADLYELRQHLQKRQRLSSARNSDYNPSFTVIIPAHNEKGTILRAIKSILKNKYPQEKVRIAVVDDGLTDGTGDIVRKYKLKHQVKNLHIISQKNEGKANALNNGLRKYSKSELVMCLDADSYISNNALRTASQYFIDPRVKALASNVRIIPTGTFLNILQRYEYLVCYQMKRAHSVFNIEYIIGGIGSTFRRESIESINYYDGDTVTEDIDITMKILQGGNKENKVIYGSDVIAYTESVFSIRDLIRQRFRWKWGRSQTFYKNRNLFFNSDSKFTKALTWVYLPYAIFSDVAFFFEPLMVGYIFYVTAAYKDAVTLLSAILVMTLYLGLNVLMESTLKWKEKIVLLPLVPGMYFFFYVLSFVEYVALAKTIFNVHKIRESINEKMCSWKHVERRVVV